MRYEFKEYMVKYFIDLTKVKTRNDGKMYIYINRKKYIAANYEALINVLYSSLCEIIL